MNFFKNKLLLFSIFSLGMSIPFMMCSMQNTLIFGKRGSKLGLLWHKQKPYCAIRINNDHQRPWPVKSIEKKFFDRYRQEANDVNEKNSYAYERKLIFVKLHDSYNNSYYQRNNARELVLKWHQLQASPEDHRVMPTSLNETSIKTGEEEYAAYCFLRHSGPLYYFNNQMVASNNNVGDFYGIAHVDSSLLKKWLRPHSDAYLRKQIEKYIKQICDTPTENVIIKNGY